MTKLLYLDSIENCYIKEFEAKIVSTLKNSVELDRTAFYPGGGGQPNDEGWLDFEGDRWRVKKVLRKAGRILHELDREPPEVGSTVKCTLDWDLRYPIMRYHTAHHVLSKIIFNEFGSEITGNIIYPTRARMDFNMERSLDKEKQEIIETKANNIIEEGRPINIKIVPREEASKILDPRRTRLDMIPEHIKEIRIIDLQNFDVEACGGIHVKNTHEIGRLKITKTQSKGKTNKRIEFVLE